MKSFAPASLASSLLLVSSLLTLNACAPAKLFADLGNAASDPPVASNTSAQEPGEPLTSEPAIDPKSPPADSEAPKPDSSNPGKPETSKPKPAPEKAKEPPPPPRRTSIQLRNTCSKPVRLQVNRGSVLHTSLNSNTSTSQSIDDGDTVALMDEKDRKELGKIKIAPGMKEIEIHGSACDQIRSK